MLDAWRAECARVGRADPVPTDRARRKAARAALELLELRGSVDGAVACMRGGLADAYWAPRKLELAKVVELHERFAGEAPRATHPRASAPAPTVAPEDLVVGPRAARKRGPATGEVPAPPNLHKLIGRVGAGPS